MTTLDDLWYLADEADRRAEQAYHRLADHHETFLEFAHEARVSRRRFRTLAERIRDTGTPYGAHTIVYRPSGELLLVYHEGVDLWVLPGGGVDTGETFREAAERELAEEAGIDASYDGLAMANRVDVRCGEYDTWGVVPIFEARAESVTPSVQDPDDEIRDARWFTELPEETRDRDELETWRERALA